MSDPFLAEIKIFGCNFAPRGYAQCNGQLLPIAQNTALFALLGTNYGGDGRSTFGLPNLQGRAALQWGNGAGLSSYSLGQIGGNSTITLTTSQIPAHNHAVQANLSGTLASPTNDGFGNPGTQRPAPRFYNNGTPSPVNMAPTAVSVTGGSQPHNNMMPYNTVNFCIALQGIFPQRP